jgi:uracil-DNA glycosylase family 4
MILGQNPPQDPVRGLHGAYLLHYKDESIRGPHEKLVHRLVAHLGLETKQVYATQTVKCQTPDNAIPGMDVAKLCSIKYLVREIADVNPLVILAFGDIAWRTLNERFPISDNECETFIIKPVGGSCDIDARRWGMMIKAPHPSTVVRFCQEDDWLKQIGEQYEKAKLCPRPLTHREVAIAKWRQHA